MGIYADMAGKHYVEDLDLDHVSFDGYTSMNGTDIDGRLDARCLSINGNANMQDLRVYDRFYGWNMDITGNADLSDSSLGDWYFRGSTVGKTLSARDAHVTGDADLNGVDAERMHLAGITVDGTLSLGRNKTGYVDLRGASIEELHIDELDAYEFRVDDDTYIGAVSEGYGLPDDIELTEQERTWYDAIHDRPRFPNDRYDGCVFTRDTLGTNFVLDDERNGLLGSLTRKGVVHGLDDAYRIIRSDV